MSTGMGIYDGEMCVRVVKEAHLLHVAVVDNPAQRFSVFFLTRKNFDARKIQELVIRLDTPWHGWSLTKEDRKPITLHFKILGETIDVLRV